jgi:fused signal recognition particle receptor
MSWLERLKSGLSRSSDRLVGGIHQALGGRKLDEASLGELEDTLVTADLGPAVAGRIVGALRSRRFEAVDDDAVRGVFADEIAKILAPVAQAFDPKEALKPHVVLVVGVNGSGKTTTIGKLANGYAQAGWKVMVAACDTFRAAAVSQLKVWGERAGVPVITGPERGDPAALAYQAFEQARADGADILFIDTAGRLHNKADLMAELQKIIRVVRKLDPAAPHDVLLVLDATTGQNAIAQVETFKSIVDVSGLIVTKLDGSARGGVLVAIAEKFGLPVVAIGVGEAIEDLQPFAPEAFARGLLALD